MPHPERWGMAASLLFLLMSGCQSAPAVVRGQGPAETPVYAPTGTEVVYGDQNGGYGGGAYGDDCGPNCDGQMCRGFYAPRQFYRATYKVPGNLKYPTPNQPPAVIQYPYYTHKGPDCFFYTGK